MAARFNSNRRINQAMQPFPVKSPAFNALAFRRSNGQLSTVREEPTVVSSSPTSNVLVRLPNEALTHHWLDFTCVAGLRALIKLDGYAGKVSEIDHEGQRFCVDETEILNYPGHYQILPRYIASLESYNESICRGLVRQVARHVRCLHAHRVVHRDLTEDSIRIVNGKVQLFSLEHMEALTHKRVIGIGGRLIEAYAYRAPEIEREVAQTEAVDVWSVGVFLYFLLTGLVPFRGNHMELVTNKHSGVIAYDISRPSDSACHLIELMLLTDPSERITIEQVLDHEWMNEDDEILEAFDLSLAKDFLSDWDRCSRRDR